MENIINLSYNGIEITGSYKLKEGFKSDVINMDEYIGYSCEAMISYKGEVINQYKEFCAFYRKEDFKNEDDLKTHAIEKFLIDIVEQAIYSTILYELTPWEDELVEKVIPLMYILISLNNHEYKF